MSKTRSEELQEAHDKGQTDASNGEYEKPHGALDIATEFSIERTGRMIENNEAYDKGQDHHKSQK